MQFPPAMLSPAEVPIINPSSPSAANRDALLRISGFRRARWRASRVFFLFRAARRTIDPRGPGPPARARARAQKSAHRCGTRPTSTQWSDWQGLEEEKIPARRGGLIAPGEHARRKEALAARAHKSAGAPPPEEKKIARRQHHDGYPRPRPLFHRGRAK